MVLRWLQKNHVPAVRQGKDAQLLSGHALLDHDLEAGLAEVLLLQHPVHGVVEVDEQAGLLTHVLEHLRAQGGSEHLP